ncbi:MAG: helix-hairpin-helix domain-containing protein [Colwellia sp.]
MNNQSRHFKKAFSAIRLSGMTLGILLLANSPLVHAKDVSVTPHIQVEAAKHKVVNLNKSTPEQLATLKGIGQTKAQAIVLYRQKFGDFKSINELTKVSGIGDKIVNDNKLRLSL